MNGLLLVIVGILLVIMIWVIWQNVVLHREVNQMKKNKEVKDKDSNQGDVEVETGSGASSSGINVPTRGGISHVPVTTDCTECSLPKSRSTSESEVYAVNASRRRSSLDATVSADELFPRVTTCQVCGEIVNVWTVNDNRNGNRGRKYTKCSSMHFVWLDYVHWTADGKKVLKRRN